MKILNVASLGDVKRMMRFLDISEIFHVSIVLILSDGTRLVVQKNEVVEMSILLSENDASEINLTRSDPIFIHSKSITLWHCFEETILNEGVDRFWNYTLFDNNCQDFIIMFLKTLHRGETILPDNVVRFVKDGKLQQLFTSSIVQTIANESVAVAKWARTILKS